MGRRYDIDALAGTLYDQLAGAPIACQHDIRGYDVHEIAKLLDVPLHICPKVIRNQRLIFGGDEINIPIHVCGLRRIYHLSADILAGQPWQATRIKNQIAQEQVNLAWWRSMFQARSHDPVQARYAAAVVRDHERLLEDLKGLF